MVSDVVCCIARDKWTELFPTRLSSFIFLSYMVLFINQGILVTSTKSANNTYSYNTTTVVLLGECLKLVVSVVVYLSIKGHSVGQLVRELTTNTKVLLLYMVPAALYCLYNNLAFVNLAAFDPTTYYLLLQFRVVVTGVLFQLVFKKRLSGKQWLSLLLLTTGCIVKQIHGSSVKGVTLDLFHLNLLLLLVQVFCSCFAGVYNEYLLKDAGTDVHIMMQNIFMYLDSILCNLLALALRGSIQTAFTREALGSVFLQPTVLAVVANNAACGIVTSLFLKSLNSILKTFASALELLFTVVLCWLIFGIPIDPATMLAIAIVSYATYLYTQNPVVNQGKIPQQNQEQV